jgi:4-amino-4-deoxy-L-arabinose transferase-like glycosyltransferase
MARPVWKELLIVAAFILATTLPFINQPFHMDDPGFIEFARVRQDAPLEMQLHDYVFFGLRNDTFFDTHPPLVSSYLALLIYASGGESEALFHAAFLVFPLLAAVSMFFLARRFTRHALLTALLLMATPGVMVMSHTLMSDVPGISFWLATVALYVYGLDRRSPGLMALCAVTMTLGIFTSYQMLSVIPLLFVYAALRRELSLLALIPFTLPVSCFASYTAWHAAAAGSLPRFSYGEGDPATWYSLIRKASSVMVALAGASVFAAVLYRVLITRVTDYLVYLALLTPIAASIFYQYVIGYFSAVSAILVILLMPLGMVLLYQLFDHGLRQARAEWGRPRARAATMMLLLWLAGGVF